MIKLHTPPKGTNGDAPVHNLSNILDSTLNIEHQESEEENVPHHLRNVSGLKYDKKHKVYLVEVR